MEKMMMMMIRSPENPSNETISEEPITATTCPSWKLYENPFYYSQHQQQQQQQQQHHHYHHRHHQHQQQKQTRNKHHHRLQLPLSARKIAASFWDLTFFRPIMDSELDIARAQIIELKAELEFERKARKKVESMNKRLAKDLNEERRGREAMERVCEELAKEISSDKAEISWMKREIEEERKMLRMAEVLREERVQMKLADAKFLLEEKLLELEVTKQTQVERPSSKMEHKNQEDNGRGITTASAPAAISCGESARFIPGEKPTCNDSNAVVPSMAIQRRASPETENPHIKRGIKGFVEFPRVVRAIGSRSRHLGTKLECQKAQLRILLKQKNPIRSNSLIMS